MFGWSPLDSNEARWRKVIRYSRFRWISDFKELCDELSISTATGRNWIKLGKITPEYTEKKTPYFSKKYMKSLHAELQSGKNKALKSRRNKKFVSGNSLYNSYVSEQCKNIPALQRLLTSASDNNIVLDISTIQLLVADCALHLFLSKTIHI